MIFSCAFSASCDTKFTRIRSDSPRQTQNQKLCQFQKTLYSSAFADTTQPKSTQAISFKCDFTPYTDTNSNLKKNRNWPFMQVLADGVVLALMRIPDRAEVAHGLRQAAVGDGDDITNGYCDSLTSNSNRQSSEFFHNQESAPVSRYRFGSSRWSNASRIGVSTPMPLFQTKKQHSPKIPKFGPFPLGITKHIGQGRSGPYSAKYKEFFPSPRWGHCGQGIPGPVPVGIYRKSLS